MLGCVMKTFFFNYSGIRKLLKSAYGQVPDKEDIAAYLAPLKLKHTVHSLFDMVRKSYSTKFLKLREITQPSLLIWGDKDSWIPLKNGEKLNKILPHSQLVKIHGAAHCSMETRADTVNNTIIHFLDSINH
jgi:pimeloyl-ACP methyl ester carboxylesterase